MEAGMTPFEKQVNKLRVLICSRMAPIRTKRLDLQWMHGYVSTPVAPVISRIFGCTEDSKDTYMYVQLDPSCVI